MRHFSPGQGLISPMQWAALLTDSWQVVVVVVVAVVVVLVKCGCPILARMPNHRKTEGTEIDKS